MKFHLCTGFETESVRAKDVKCTQVPLLWRKVFTECNHVAASDSFMVPMGDIKCRTLAGYSSITVSFVHLYCFYSPFSSLGQEYHLVTGFD